MPLKKRNKIAALAEEIDALREQIAGLQSAGATQRRPKRTARRTPGSKKRTRREKSPDRKPAKTRVATTRLGKQELADGPVPAVPVYELKDARVVEVGESDAELFDSARHQWLTGDWDALAGWHVAEFANHPKRARIALLIAAALHEVGDFNGSKEALRQAVAWGAQRWDLVNVVIGQAHAALGRARLSTKEFDRAEKHFLACVTSIAPNRSALDYARNRVFREAIHLGYFPEARKLLGSELSLLKRSPTVGGPQVDQFAKKLAALEEIASSRPQRDSSPATTESRSNQAALQSSALSFYSALPGKENGSRIPFVLLDSKSLPRSGLHFLKNSLSRLFGENFSFCSWYQDAGCCKCMPCALTGFASESQSKQVLRIRLTKSHDFRLADPIFKTGFYARRVILIRDPLKVLTSWFALDQLNAYTDELSSSGIRMPKIWLHHEKEVTRAAFECMDANFKVPSQTHLREWLERKEHYCAGFMRKWVSPMLTTPPEFTEIVQYEHITHYLRKLVDEYKQFVGREARDVIEGQLLHIEATFRPREDTFAAPSRQLSSFLRTNAASFTAAADRLNALHSFQFAFGGHSLRP